jgi:cell wall-associated NlpC family hydrolase
VHINAYNAAHDWVHITSPISGWIPLQPFSTLSTCDTIRARGQSVVKAASGKKGTTIYSWDGGHGSTPGQTKGIKQNESPYCYDRAVTGLDCSGLTRYAVHQGLGSDLLGAGNDASQFSKVSAMEDFRAGNLTAIDLEVGDILFFGGYMAIYSGSRNMVQSSGYKPDCSWKHVSEDAMGSYWVGRLQHVVRVM